VMDAFARIRPAASRSRVSKDRQLGFHCDLVVQNTLAS
jgi:hypothetical protein